MSAQRTLTVILFSALAMAFPILALPSPSHTATDMMVPTLQLVAQVNTFTDEYDAVANSTCSLREAVKAINDFADFGGCVLGTVPGTEPNLVLLPSGTYTLTIMGGGEDLDATGDIDIRRTITISPTGVLTASVLGNTGWNDRLVHVVTGTLNIKHMEFRGGDTSGDLSYGQGGGMRIDPGTVATVTDSMFVTNSAYTSGGIINYGKLTMTNTVVAENSSSLSGGGITSYHADMALTNVTIRDNHAQSTYGDGGGIYMVDGVMTLNGVTIYGNKADSAGGGIYQIGGTTTLTNDTVSGNTAQYGGGLSVPIGTVSLNNVTFYGNSAGQGGGISMSSSNTNYTIRNTIVANSPSGGNCFVPVGGSFNLSTDDTCGFTSTRDKVTIRLGPLANNGGSTLTHMLLPGSPAIDNGTSSNCPLTDQRGKPRIIQHCDVGAVERQSDDPGIPLFLPLILR